MGHTVLATILDLSYLSQMMNSSLMINASRKKDLKENGKVSDQVESVMVDGAAFLDPKWIMLLYK